MDMKALIISVGLVLVAVPPLAADSASVRDVPIFDTHMHYSRDIWNVYSPGDVLEKMDKANVGVALVSSTPDDGTMMLYDLAPERIVPGFRPYRTPGDRARWYMNPDLLAYNKLRLASRRYKVLGEVHLYVPENLKSPEMAEYLNIVAEQNMVLHPHSYADVVKLLLKRRPEQKILWAHAGFSEPPSVVAQMLDRYPNLWAELSFRAEHIMPNDELDPEWRDLLIRHAGRFTIGSDTWEVDRWGVYKGLIDEHRSWLSKLPPDVATKIAYRNAEALFGKRRPSQ
jgi:hypothetical protein